MTPHLILMKKVTFHTYRINNNNYYFNDFSRNNIKFNNPEIMEFLVEQNMQKKNI